jgi:hypothetical protein
LRALRMLTAGLPARRSFFSRASWCEGSGWKALPRRTMGRVDRWVGEGAKPLEGAMRVKWSGKRSRAGAWLCPNCLWIRRGGHDNVPRRKKSRRCQVMGTEGRRREGTDLVGGGSIGRK